MMCHGSERYRCSMKMAKAIILVLGLSIFTAQSAMLRNEDAVYTRVARSPCYSCYHTHGSLPPPPPPPYFRTHQWSSYARSPDGYQQGVFSGAAAAAGSDNEASGQAFSIAASDARSDSAHNTGSDQSAKFASKYSYGGYGDNLQNSQSNLDGFKSDSTAQSSSFGTGKNSGVGRGFEYGKTESRRHPVHLLNDANFGSAAQSSANAQAGGQEQYQDSGPKSLFANHGPGIEQNSAYRGQTGGMGHYQDSIGQNSAYRGPAGGPRHYQGSGQDHYQGSGQENFQGSGQENFQGSGQKEISAHRGDVAEQRQHYGDNLNARGEAVVKGYFQGSGQHELSSYHGDARGYGQGQRTDSQAFSPYNGNSGQKQQSNYAEGDYTRPSGSDGASEQENAHSALGGALDLASQGLKTADGAQSGCSTCGKNSYAVSNAKSHSGSAVALSIGG